MSNEIKENTNNSDIGNSHLSHLVRQYEFLTKHLEYHDSNVFKSLSIYFLFSGAIVAKIDLFYVQKDLSAVLVGTVGTIFALMLFRTAVLLSELKVQIDEIDTQIYKIHNQIKIPSISSVYTGKGIWNWFRTSVVGCILSIVLTGCLVLHLINYQIQG